MSPTWKEEYVEQYPDAAQVADGGEEAEDGEQLVGHGVRPRPFVYDNGRLFALLFQCFFIVGRRRRRRVDGRKEEELDGEGCQGRRLPQALNSHVRSNKMRVLSAYQ